MNLLTLQENYLLYKEKIKNDNIKKSEFSHYFLIEIKLSDDYY